MDRPQTLTPDAGPRGAQAATPEVADAELVARAQAGELDAFEALTQRYEQRVYSLALRMLRHEQDAEDVTQQTFLSALEGLDGFRGDAIFRHVAPAHRDARRAEGHSQAQGPGHGIPGGSHGAGGGPRGASRTRSTLPIGGSRPTNWCIGAKSNGCWMRPWRSLDEKHRLVFLLRDVEGLSVKETAEALGLSEANTKVRLLRARLQLREELTRTLGDPARRVERAEHDALCSASRIDLNRWPRTHGQPPQHADACNLLPNGGSI